MYIGLALLIICTLALVIIKFSKGSQGRVKSKLSQEEPNVTVVFFLKDNEDNLEWLIRRLMFLRYGNYETFEILLVDRGSKDRTLEVATLLQRQYAAVNLINGVGSLVSAERFLRASTSRLIVMEELSSHKDCSLIINRMRQLLRKGLVETWDQSPAKIETIGQYNFNRHNDTIK